jgi:site-specific recombinase XerC
MKHLSPPTLTRAEQAALLATTRPHARDHLTFSLALGTGLRLAEIVGLDMMFICLPDVDAGRKPRHLSPRRRVNPPESP